MRYLNNPSPGHAIEQSALTHKERRSSGSNDSYDQLGGRLSNVRSIQHVPEITDDIGQETLEKTLNIGSSNYMNISQGRRIRNLNDSV